MVGRALRLLSPSTKAWQAKRPPCKLKDLEIKANRLDQRADKCQKKQGLEESRTFMHVAIVPRAGQPGANPKNPRGFYIRHRVVTQSASSLFMKHFLRPPGSSVLALLFLAWLPSCAAAEPAAVYDSRARGNDFDGSKPLAALGFTDQHGGVASLADGLLVLTPDDEHRGTDASSRDFVRRVDKSEQGRDVGCQVTLPPHHRTGSATVGILLRGQADGTGLLLNFAPENNPSLLVYSLDRGVATLHGSAGLSSPFVDAHPLTLEARVVADAAVAFTATDPVSGQVLGFLNVPLDFGTFPAGSFGLVPWTTSPGQGSIRVSSVQTYPVTAVACDGDSLTRGENATSGIGTASPLAPTYPGVLQKLLGNRFHVFNLGRSGLTLTAMNGDAARRVDALLASAELPPVVVLEGGTNDFGIDGTIKPPMSVTQAAQTVYGRLQTYWTARHAARGDVKVVDVTNLPAGHPVYTRNLGSRAGFNQRREALNALRLHGTGGARPDLVVDLTTDPHLGRDGSEQNPTYFQADDQTHLTDAGYAAKAALVAPAVRRAAGR